MIYTDLTYFFSKFEPVRCSMSSSNCCFLTCIHVSLETGKVVCYSHLFQNFPVYCDPHSQRLQLQSMKQKQIFMVNDRGDVLIRSLLYLFQEAKLKYTFCVIFEEKEMKLLIFIRVILLLSVSFINNTFLCFIFSCVCVYMLKDSLFDLELSNNTL